MRGGVRFKHSPLSRDISFPMDAVASIIFKMACSPLIGFQMIIFAKNKGFLCS